MRSSEAALIGPIIGHSDRAAPEQKLSSHHTPSSQPLVSIDATLHETPAIQKAYDDTHTHVELRGTITRDMRALAGHVAACASTKTNFT